MSLEDFPRRRTRGRPPKYDWDKYFQNESGSDSPGWHVLVRGRDFQTKVQSFRALVHSTARGRNDGPWRAETQIKEAEGQVAFRFVRTN